MTLAGAGRVTVGHEVPGSALFAQGLDQLRALAILQVLAVHTLDRFFPGGGIGVGIFFALSGYLTASKLLAHQRLGLASVAAFACRRITRLYPAFLVAMAGIGLVIVLKVPDRWPHFMAAWPDLLLFWRPEHWEPLGIGVGILWSMRVEVQYYIALPLAMWWLGSRRGLIGLCVILMVASTLRAMLGLSELRGEGITYYGFGMATGSLLAWVEAAHPEWLRASAWRHGWVGGYGVLLALLFIPQIGPRVWWLELTAAAVATCAVMGSLLHDPRRRVLPGAVTVSHLAYCLYLVHGPVIDWMRPVLGLTMWGKLIWFLPLTFGFAWAIHVLVERPAIRWGRRWAGRLESAGR